ILVRFNGQTYPFNREHDEEKFEVVKNACVSQDSDTIEELLFGEQKKYNAVYGDQIKVEDGIVYVDGEELPKSLGEKLVDFANQKKDYTPLIKFWNKLRNNPSNNSVNQLFTFIENHQVPLYEDGDFKVWKKIQNDFTDFYTGKINNSPGEVVKMPR